MIRTNSIFDIHLFALRKGSAIFLCSLLCLSLFGYQLFYFLQIAEAKKEMQHYIGSLKKQGLLTTVYVSDKDMNQVAWENESEFIYHHELYDLVEKKKTKDGFQLICLADKNEESLIKTYSDYNDQSSPSHTSSASLFKLINQAFVVTVNINYKTFEITSPILTSQHITHLPSQLRFVLIPPPKIVS